MASYLRESEDAPIQQINQVQTKLVWVIGNFEEQVRLFKNIASPIFTTIVDQIETNWQLIMTFNGVNKDNEELLSIFIKCLNNSHFILTVQFSIVDINNKEVNMCSIREHMWEAGLHSFVHLMKKNDLIVKKFNLLHEGKLKIITTISTNQYIDIEKGTEDHLAQSLRVEESKHSLNFLNDVSFSDVVFSVQGKEIHTNKSILANRSPVFLAMFKHDMTEARNNYVVVEDIPYSTLYDLFKFIYTGLLPSYYEQHHKNYLDLFMAADKYDLKMLKLGCEINVSKSLKIDNVFATLTLADAYNASILKERAIHFIVSNADDIIETPAFKEFGKWHSELSAEVFRALVVNRKKNDDFP